MQQNPDTPSLHFSIKLTYTVNYWAISILAIGEQMTRDEFRSKFAEIVEISPDSITDEMPLDMLENWDSVSMVSFIALADTHVNARLSARQLRECNTVGDLLNVAKV